MVKTLGTQALKDSVKYTVDQSPIISSSAEVKWVKAITWFPHCEYGNVKLKR